VSGSQLADIHRRVKIDVLVKGHGKQSNVVR